MEQFCLKVFFNRKPSKPNKFLAVCNDGNDDSAIFDFIEIEKKMICVMPS